MLGVELGRWAVRVGGRDRLVVVDVAALAHRHLGAGVADDDHGLDRRRLVEERVHRRLDLGDLALAAGGVDGDQRLRVGELHPLLDRLRREAAEDDVVGGSDSRAGKHRHRHLGDHRQVDPDHVARLHPALDQDVGEPLDVAVKVGVGDRALLALLAVPVEGDPVAAAGLDVAVEAVDRGVQPAVGEPAVEGRVRVVEDLGRLDEPVEIAGQPRPPGVGVGRRPSCNDRSETSAAAAKAAGGSKRSCSSSSLSSRSRSCSGVSPLIAASFPGRVRSSPWVARYPLRRVLPDRPSVELPGRLRRDLRRHRPRAALDRRDPAGAAALRHRPARGRRGRGRDRHRRVCDHRPRLPSARRAPRRPPGPPPGGGLGHARDRRFGAVAVRPGRGPRPDRLAALPRRRRGRRLYRRLGLDRRPRPARPPRAGDRPLRTRDLGRARARAAAR